MKHWRTILLFLIPVLFSGCANTGTPGGGPKDETPPRLIKSIPEINKTNYKDKKVEIYFDELISIESPSEKVIISPPQVISPIVKAIGKRASVTFMDSLVDNTTYTIDFTDAIVDYNEKNKFGDFAFTFSTGSQIDSLRLGGRLLDASNLDPVPGVLIGAHKDLNDSAFVRTGFRSISKTDKNGLFTIKGLSKDSFHVFALGDKNRDYKFDQPGEAIAFTDSVFVPWTEPCLKSDTIWKDSITVDSVWTRTVTCYKPDNIVLLYFNEEFGRQYLAKKERSSRERLTFTFGYKSDSLPKLRLLNSEAKSWNLLETNLTKDTLIYWITDTAVVNMDTLHIEISYLKTDSTNNLSPAVDTLNLISRKVVHKAPSKSSKKADEEKKKEEEEKAKVIPLECNIYAPATIDIGFEPYVEFFTPVLKVEGNPWHLKKKKSADKKDSTWIDVPVKMIQDSLNIRFYNLKAKIDPAGEYKLSLDSGKITDVYGHLNLHSEVSFKVREEKEYARLMLTVNGINTKSFVELLDKSDKVVRRERVVKGLADFKYVKPGTYFIRAIEDRNGNFRWDVGNYRKKMQPEGVFYRREPQEMRVNCDYEETWDVMSVPLELQKNLDSGKKNKD